MSKLSQKHEEEFYKVQIVDDPNEIREEYRKVKQQLVRQESVWSRFVATPLIWTAAIVVAFALAAAGTLLVGYILMLSWNYGVTAVVPNISQITLWNAVALLVFLWIVKCALFGGINRQTKR